jgi:hypothetical protein
MREKLKNGYYGKTTSNANKKIKFLDPLNLWTTAGAKNPYLS